MDRRRFLLHAAASAGGVATLTPIPALAQSITRTIKSEVDGVRRPWRYNVMNDPTGTAPTRRVERFELRGGDCQLGDCVVREGPLGPQTRARVERHVITDLESGERGQFVISIFFPSSEYNFLPRVMTVTGQLFAYDRPQSDWDGGPLWLIESDPGTRDLFVTISRFWIDGGRLQSDNFQRFPIGQLGQSIQMDQWNQFIVNVNLAPDSTGSVETYLNGRGVMQYRGPTMLPGTVLGYSYGIYQVRTNQYPGGAAAIPPQVVYYAAPRLVRL